MYHHFTGLTSDDADRLRARRVELSSTSDESPLFGCIGHGWYSRGHFNTFTYLVTVYYTNILRRNRTTFAFIVRKKLPDKLINITVPVSKVIFFPLTRKVIKKKTCQLHVAHLMYS